MTQSAGVIVVKVLTVVTQVALRVAPAPDMYRVYKKKTTGNMALTPIVSLLVCNHIWLLYAYAVDNFFPLFSVCLFGDVVLLFFTAVFVRYCSDRRYVAKIVGIGLVSFVLVTIYAILALAGAIPQSKHQAGVVLGYIADIVSLGLDISPFEKLRLVFASKSSESIPAILSGVIVANSVMWLLNGIIDNDLFIIIPNIVGIVLGSLQLTLWYIYRPGRYPVQNDEPSVEIIVNAEGGTSHTSSTPVTAKFQPLFSPPITAK